MHIFTHLKESSKGKTGLGVYPDGMVEHDGHFGQLLVKLDELGIADNTIVMYSTDNGAETFSWPDGGTTPFRGEKNTQWEGGYRVLTLYIASFLAVCRSTCSLTVPGPSRCRSWIIANSFGPGCTSKLCWR